MSSTQTVGYCVQCDGWVWVNETDDRVLGDHHDAKGSPCQNAGSKPAAFGTIAIAHPTVQPNLGEDNFVFVASPPA